ncbi:MAG: RNA-binding protein, partial [Acidobacteria bacterium]|nr:RNA-binding protein [Acidobacteriota bacterium]
MAPSPAGFGASARGGRVSGGVAGFGGGSESGGG